MRVLTRLAKFGALLPLLSLVLVVGCKSNQEKIESYMAKADAFVAEGRDEESIIELRNVLSVDPNYGPAHFNLAKSYIRIGNVGAAIWELRETIRLDPDNDEARRSLGGLALAARQFEEALEQADAAIARDFSAGDAYVIRGQALEGLERLDEAESAFRAAIDLRPDDQGYRMLLAGFYERAGSVDKAEEILLEVLEAEASYEAYMAYAFFLHRVGGRSADVEVAFEKALGHAKQSQKHHVYSSQARIYAAAGQDDKAEALLKEGIEKAHMREPLILQLTKFYRVRGEDAKADALIQKVTEDRRSTNPEPHLTLSAYRMDRGDLAGALAAADAALTADPAHGRSKLRKAEVLLQLGFDENAAQVSEARVLAEQVLAEDPKNEDALFVLAKVQIAESKVDEAIGTLQEIVVARPDWAAAHMVLGSALLERGDVKAARASLARAIELDAGMLDARYLMARAHSSLGEHEYAIEQARVFLRVHRGHSGARLLVAESLAALGRREDAQREIEAVPDEDRGAEVHYALGQLATLRGDYAEAREQLLSANTDQPNNPRILQALLTAELRLGDLDASLARIEAAAKANPEDANIQALSGRVRVLTQDHEGAEKAYKRAIVLAPESIGAYQALADLYHGMDRLDDSIATYDKAIAARPEIGSLYERRALLLQRKGDRASMMKNYELAIEKDPSLGLSKNNLAYNLVETGGDLNRALLLAQQARELRPEDPGSADTLGWVLVKKGKATEAIEYLEEAAKGFRGNERALVVVNHHLAVAYEASGNSTKAAALLANVVADLDAQAQAARDSGTELQEPGWATEARAMSARLNN